MHPLAYMDTLRRPLYFVCFTTFAYPCIAYQEITLRLVFFVAFLLLLAASRKTRGQMPTRFPLAICVQAPVGAQTLLALPHI